MGLPLNEIRTNYNARAQLEAYIAERIERHTARLLSQFCEERIGDDARARILELKMLLSAVQTTGDATHE